MVSLVKVELPHQTGSKGDISKSITQNMAYWQSLEARRAVRPQLRQPEAQQKPVVHLLMEAVLGCKWGPVQTAAPQPSQLSHRSRAEAHPRYASSKSGHRYDRDVEPPAAAGLYTLPGKLVPCHA